MVDIYLISLQQIFNMKRILSFLFLLLLAFNGSSQTKIWTVGPSFWGNYDYKSLATETDAAGNVFMFYSTRLQNYGTEYYYLEKFNPQGQRDLSFGVNGVLDVKSLLGYASSEFPFFYSLTLTDDNKLLLFLGSPASANPWLVKFNTDGTLDQGFGVNGIKNIYNNPAKYKGHYNSVLTKVGSRYFISHNYTDMQNKPRTEIGCFDASLNLVTGFGDQGIKPYELASPYQAPQISVLRKAGDYLYIYAKDYTPGLSSVSHLGRLHIDSGLIDTTYPNNNFLYLESSNAHIQPDGTAYIANSVSVSGAQKKLVIKKYHSNGALDTGFGDNGTRTIAYSWVGLDYMTMYTLPDGDLLIGIKYSSTASSGGIQDALLKLKPNGDINTSFGGDISNNGIPIPGIFGIGSIYGAPIRINFKPDHFIVTSTGTSIAVSKVNYTTQVLAALETVKGQPVIFYPNPVKTVMKAKTGAAKNAVINIYDAQGKLVLKDKTIKNNEDIDLSFCAAGMYIIKVKTDGKEFVQKIIKE